MKTDVRGYMIDVDKVKALAERSTFEEVREYHKRSLGLIDNALLGGDLNPKQIGWLKRLSDNVVNQYNKELGV